jgi:hypothetical protein
MTTIRMRVLSVTLRREQPMFAIVLLSRVITSRSDLVAFGASESGTMELEINIADLKHFIPGSDVVVTIAPAARAQA